MHIVSSALVVLVALEHLYFLTLEMFLWTTPRGLKAFGMTPEQAAATATLAKNQGLYNGFLAAGLLWSVLATDRSAALDLKTFFLGCVIVAGVYGAATVSSKILWLQATPALAALAAVWLTR